MANWMHTYRPGQIPPQGVINETTPGRQIAESITEIHNKALTDIQLALSGGLSGDVEVEGNTATISLDAPEIELDGFTGTITVATSVSYNSSNNRLTISRRNLTYKDGLLESETAASNVVLQLASGLPTGGQQYQVLQRGAGGVAIWDWVRFP